MRQKHGTKNTDWGWYIKVQSSVSENAEHEQEQDRGPNISNNITLTGSMKEDAHDDLI